MLFVGLNYIFNFEFFKFFFFDINRFNNVNSIFLRFLLFLFLCSDYKGLKFGDYVKLF